MRQTILTIRAGMCRYPTTDAPPHMFCGEPVLDDCTPYCEEHHFLCYAGYGKRTPDQLAEMIYNAEGTITRVEHRLRGPVGGGPVGCVKSYAVAKDSNLTVPIDVLIGDDK